MSESQLRVATFNARHGAGRFGLVSTGELVDRCRLLKADILAMQELDRRVVRSWFVDQPRLISRWMGHRSAVAPTKRTPVGGWQCNAIMASGPIDDVETVELPESGERRVMLMAQAGSKGGGAYSVACTHLATNRGARAQLDAALDAFSARPLPRIFMGDLNLREDVVVPALEAAGYQTAPGHGIDWIAVAGDIEITSFETMPTTVSDHDPVVAEIGARSER